VVKEVKIYGKELNENSSDSIIKLTCDFINKEIVDNKKERIQVTSERKKLMEFLIDIGWSVSAVAKVFNITRQRVYRILSKEDK
jgi:DNA invertase Pin-like site-specific DNA recombinase